MPYVLPDGRRVSPEQRFDLGGNQYPRNWLKLSSPERREALGIVWEADPPAPAPVDPPLADVKAQLSKQVDADAEVVRLKYITPGAGMVLTYQEKHAQARAVNQIGEAAANALTDAERFDLFPTLAASVGTEAVTLWSAAQTVIQCYEAYADISYGIERARLAAKKAISEATTAAAARAVYEAITWP